MNIRTKLSSPTASETQMFERKWRQRQTDPDSSTTILLILSTISNILSTGETGEGGVAGASAVFKVRVGSPLL
jgi:hypothetical protein|eukprot:m.421001 g.421001  ORF g.421001 m.421001 type:complete len:73 (+) comp33280_c0_seq1:65-283(+)